MQILTVNVGSSSVRLTVHQVVGNQVTCLGRVHAEGQAQEAEALVQRALQTAQVGSVDAVAHRIVHGGPQLRRATLVNAEVLALLEDASVLAPLHNPPALRFLHRLQQGAVAQVPHVAVLDTSFFVDMPQVAKRYALPQALCEEHHLQRYGFHGLAHNSMWQSYAAVRPAAKATAKVISLQLGSGCSMAALRGGVAQDTSMGFSPLEGLVMGSRCGDVDPGLLLYLQQQVGITPEALKEMLESRSGLLGVSAHSSDMRELCKLQTSAAKFAVELFCARARKYLGAYLTVLQGCDALIFGGGIGENQAIVRERIVAGLGWLGVKLSETEPAAGAMRLISAADSTVEVWVAAVDEAAVAAGQAAEVLKQHHATES
jgi:acetate kinase